MTKLKKIREQIAELQEQAKIESKNLFNSGVKELFENNPTVTSVSWTQYTPYFNDGDPCVFSSNHDYASVYTGNEEDGDYLENCSDFKTIKEFLSQFTNKDMENLFGDHVKVVLTPYGIDTEDYGHE